MVKILAQTMLKFSPEIGSTLYGENFSTDHAQI